MKKALIMLLLVVGMLGIVGCNENTTNPWDNLGGGTTGGEEPGEIDESSKIDEVDDVVTKVEPDDTTTLPDTETTLTNVLEITENGEYVLEGEITGSINVAADLDNVHIYLKDATITTPDDDTSKENVIKSKSPIVISLIGNNTITNTHEGSADAISSSGQITINGDGTLTINSGKSGIKCSSTVLGIGGTIIINPKNHGITAETIYLKGISVSVNGGEKDGLHAEMDDDIHEYDITKGYVYIGEGTTLNVKDVYGDGIQADTFCKIEGGNVNISTLPTFITAVSNESCYKKSGNTYTKVSSDEVRNYSSYYQLDQSCKGIKVGEIDYTDNEVEYTVESDKYLINISGGTISINTVDDAIHTNSGDVIISGGEFALTTSDDGIHADYNVDISNGNIVISSSYEGIEGRTVEINGGKIILTSLDDGINAADSDLSTNLQKTMCHIIISGGEVYVNAYGDGVDSNGTILFSGGATYISGPTSSGNGALDADSYILMNGGILVALGASGMVETPASNSSQCCITVNVSSTSGDFSLTKDDQTILSFSPSEIWGVSKAYSSVVVSCGEIVVGNTYKVNAGNNSSSITITGILNGGSAGGGYVPGGSTRPR